MDAITKVPFYDNELIVVEVNGEPYVAMRSITEGMGLSWSTQKQKFDRQGDKFNCVHMNTVAEDGKNREMLCMPVRKLNGWLFSINAEKCRSDIRQKVVRYQEECFQVLYDYFHQGGAINPQADGKQLAGMLDRIARHTSEAINGVLSDKLVELAGEIWKKDLELSHEKRQNHLLMNFAPKGVPGAISSITGRAKDRYVGGYFTSNRCGHPIEGLAIQPQFNF